MEERGLSMAYTTIMRWVHQDGPELDKRVRRHLKPTNDSWRVDETYIKVKDQWMYLYRAVDSEGNTIDFHLSKTRDKKSAKRFFKKALRSFHVSKPRVITVDKNPAYPIAVEELRKEKTRATDQWIIDLSDNPDLNNSLALLRESEIFHSQRFREAVEILKEDRSRKKILLILGPGSLPMFRKARLLLRVQLSRCIFFNLLSPNYR